MVREKHVLVDGWIPPDAVAEGERGVGDGVQEPVVVS